MSKIKVCILSTVDLTRMTLISVYTDYFNKNNIDFDIIFVDKNQEKHEKYNGANNMYAFHPETKQEWSKFRKLFYFWKLREFSVNIFNQNNYDFIIVWNELTAFIFSDILSKKYNKKYAINIRDYQYLNFPIVKKRLKTVIEHAEFSTVSSNAFIKYLPDNEYVMMHSFNKAMLSNLPQAERLRTKSEKIRILYIGQIRYIDNIHSVIDSLGNDSRYELVFAGGGSEEVVKYIEGKDIKNIKCYGRFQPSETIKYLKDADIIYNLYGNEHLHEITAISIKFYYALYLCIPILVFKGTEMEKISDQCGLGYSIEKEEIKNIGNQLYKWYHSIEYAKMQQKRDSFMKEVNDSNIKFEELLNSSLK